MPRRLIPLAALAALSAGFGACGGSAGSVTADRAGSTPSSTTTPTQHVLLPAPDPAGPTTRGVFLRDPRGQVEHIAAGGHLVAWSVRTPADQADDIAGDGYTELPRPIIPAKETHVVVVDERGGSPLIIRFGTQNVTGLRMVHGPGGAAEPQLAVERCGPGRSKRCGDDLYTLTPAAPLATTAHTTGVAAREAYGGVLDGGRLLETSSITGTGAGKPCLPSISIETVATGARRSLPPLPTSSANYTRCSGLVSQQLVGQYALALVDVKDPKLDLEAWDEFAIDLAAGPDARWHDVWAPYRFSEGSTADDLGPAVGGGALYWEENDDDDYMYSIGRVLLPESLTAKPTGQAELTTSDPVAPNVGNACDIAATDDAIYELDNTRCAHAGGNANGRTVIRRVVHPRFRRDVD